MREEPGGKGAHNFFAYRGALNTSFLRPKVHNQNEVTHCSNLSLFPKFLIGVLLPSHKFREWIN